MHARPLRLPALTILAAAACLLATTPAQAAEQKRPKPCPTGNTLHQNDHVVLKVRRRANKWPAVFDVIACHRKTRRRKDIATYSEQLSIADPGAPVFWLAGRFVAAHAFYCPPPGGPTCNGYIIVTDLRTGRFRRTPDTGGRVRGLVLTSGGRLAYIRTATNSPSDPNLQVVVLTANKTTSVLDAGENIDPDSLASDGRRVYWLRDGQPQFAPLG
jgi:hypothetical protein